MSEPPYNQPGWNVNTVYNVAGSISQTAPPARPVVLPYPRNLAFVGRDDELTWLDTKLAAPNAAVAVTAQGGTGKTQLAAEYAHSCVNDLARWPGGVLWISMAQPEAVANAVAAAGRALKLPGYDEWPLGQQVAAVQAAWAAPDARLLVFDNCEDLALLRAWRPTTGGTRVLLTARRTDWPHATIQRLPLPQLLPEAALDLLLRGRAALLGSSVAALADEHAAQVCEYLGFHALALHLAGAFLAQQPRHPLARLLDELRTQSLDHAALKALDADSPTAYPRAVAETIALSYNLVDQSKPADALARLLLALAAHAVPGVPLPVALLQRAAKTTDDDTNAAVQRLCAVGLASYADGDAALAIHRLVLAYARTQQNADAATAHADALAVAMIGSTYEAGSSGFPARSLTLLAHARHTADVAEQRGSEYAAPLLGNLGNVAREQGDHATAREYHSRALAIVEQALLPSHPDIASCLGNLGIVASEQGDHAAACNYFTRALAIFEQALPPGHPSIANTLNNLGVVTGVQGDHTAAHAYYTRALASWELALPPGHPDIAFSLNNLGNVASEQGDHATARAYHTSALAIFEQALPPGHPSIANSLNNLGVVAQEQGDHSASRAYHTRALAIRELALPHGHPRIATSLNKLGLVAQSQGDHAAAREYHTLALAIFEQALPANHPHIRLVRENLAALDAAEEQG